MFRNITFDRKKFINIIRVLLKSKLADLKKNYIIINVIANKFSKQISKKQHEILCHNIFTINNDNEKYISFDKYPFGSGFIDIDKDGNMLDIKFFDINDENEQIVIDDIILNKGTSAANNYLIDFTAEDLFPVFYENNIMRLAVNIYRDKLCRFIDVM